MGTLFSALDIARSGLQVSQVMLDTAGHNIANASNVGFSRQRVELVTRSPIDLTFGKIGRGVTVGLITRLRDPILDLSFRDQVQALGNAQVQADFFRQIEDIFLEPTGTGMSGRISVFFDALNEFASNVESIPVRQSVLNEAAALAETFNETFRQLDNIRTRANQEVIGQVPQINALGAQVAELNDRIVRAEVDGNPANDLRDQRDRVLDELAGLINIFTRERENGQIDVLISGDEFVTGDRFREIEAVINPALDPNRNDLVELRFVYNGQLVDVQGGEVFGALVQRDTEIPDVIDQVNTLAAKFIEEFNRIHSQGNGLSNLSGTITSTNAAVDGITAIDAAGLPFPITAGTFDVNVYDALGNITATATVTITPGVTTLNDIAAALSGFSADLSATVNVDGTLSVTATAGNTFGFSSDSSGALGSLGLNTLFTGSDARTMGVNSLIANDPTLLASGFSLDLLETGDNEAALALADLQNGLFFSGGTSSMTDFYEGIIVQVGIGARTNADTLAVEEQLVDTFSRRRQEISGVSIDEEVTFLLQFERAFEASARVVTTADRMLESLLTMAL